MKKTIHSRVAIHFYEDGKPVERDLDEGMVSVRFFLRELAGHHDSLDYVEVCLKENDVDGPHVEIRSSSSQLLVSPRASNMVSVKAEKLFARSKKK